jgi:hypothetical protein
MRGAAKWWSAVLAVAASIAAFVLVGHSDSVICSGKVPRSAAALTGAAITLAVFAIVLDWRGGTQVAPSGEHGRINATVLAILAFPIAGLAIAYYVAAPLGCGN